MAGRWFIGIGILAILSIVVVKPSFGWSVQRLLFEGVGAEGKPADQTAQDTTVLKAELARLAQLERHTSDWPIGSEPVFVYSRYPFNFKNQIVITAGAAEGVKPGDLVVLPVSEGNKISNRPILVGKIIQVFSKSALVQTVFDVGFQTAVRIGESGIDALFTGGPEPRLTLISKTAEPKPGDVVTTAAPDMPYGLPLALIDHIDMASNQVFQEASLAFGYDLNDLKVIAVQSPHVR